MKFKKRVSLLFKIFFQRMETHIWNVPIGTGTDRVDTLEKGKITPIEPTILIIYSDVTFTKTLGESKKREHANPIYQKPSSIHK